MSRRLALAAAIALFAVLGVVAIGTVKRAGQAQLSLANPAGGPTLASNRALQTPVEGMVMDGLPEEEPPAPPPTRLDEKKELGLLAGWFAREPSSGCAGQNGGPASGLWDSGDRQLPARSAAAVQHRALRED